MPETLSSCKCIFLTPCPRAGHFSKASDLFPSCSLHSKCWFEVRLTCAECLLTRGGCRMWGAGCRIWDVGCRVQDVGCRTWELLQHPQPQRCRNQAEPRAAVPQALETESKLNPALVKPYEVPASGWSSIRLVAVNRVRLQLNRRALPLGSFTSLLTSREILGGLP